MTVTVRRVGPDDVALFAQIAPDVYDQPIDPARLARYLQTSGHILVVAMMDATIVGQCAAVVHVHPDKTPELYVDEVGTASTHRRQGIARLMMDELFAWGRELGCTEAWLGTETDNEAAKGLYRRFQPSEDQTIQYFEFKLD